VNRSSILVDTGPLVALLRPSDVHHECCVDESRSLAYPFLTSWPVVTEAAWLLRETSNGVDALLNQIEQGLLKPLELDPPAVPWMRTFLENYRDLRAQLADASICYLAERESIESIFTLDRRDFSVFRSRKNQPFRLLPESLQG
jgi:uncharacterized protein